MKLKNNKIHGIVKLSIIFSIIFCSILFSAIAASAVDKTYYWDRTTGVSIAGYTTNWSSCSSSSPQSGYRVTSLGSSASSCTNGALTRSNAGDLFLAIFPTAYTSDTQIRGMTNARFYLKSNSGSATYRFDLGYSRTGTFTSFGSIIKTGVSTSGAIFTIDLSSINGTAPSGSYSALKVSVTTSKGGKVYMGTNGGSTGSNSGRFYVNETVASVPRYNVSIVASPASTGIYAGNYYRYNITVNNSGTTKGNYTLSVTDTDTGNFTRSILGNTTMQITSGGSAMTTLNVTARPGATTGALDNTTVTVISVENSAYSNSTRVQTTVAAVPTYNVSIRASPTSSDISPGNSYLYTITVNNTGNTQGNYTLSVTDSDTVNFTRSTLGSTPMQITSGGSAMTTLNVTARTSAINGALDNTTVTVISVENPAYSNSTQVRTTDSVPGPDCISCHNIGGPAPSQVNVTDMGSTNAVHHNLNNQTTSPSGYAPANFKCWACHGNGTEQSNQHSDNNNMPYICEDCHQTGNLPYTNSSLIPYLTTRRVTNHIPSPGSTQFASSIVNNSSADCKGCHDKSKVTYFDSGLSLIANVSHYASRTNLVSPTANCDLCHKNPINASAYWANLTRHPAKTQICENCHNNEMLSPPDFHGSAPLKIKRVHVDFDWQNSYCSSCHSSPKKVCEDCHLPDGSGPYVNTGNATRLNDSIPRVFAHTNFSSTINVPNQSNVYASSQGAETFSSCYSFNSTTLQGTCHAIAIQSISTSGNFFTLNNYGTSYSRGSVYHEAVTIDRMPNTTNCIFCHSQIDATIRFSWGNSTQITGGKHDWYTGNDNSKCWSCHVSTGKAPRDFHSDSMTGGKAGGPNCLACHAGAE
jgi:hypothetical protein